MKFCDFLNTIEEMPADTHMRNVAIETSRLTMMAMKKCDDCIYYSSNSLSAHIAIRLLGDRVPVIDRIDSKILNMIDINGKAAFYMGTWRSQEPRSACGTSHCRAGWAVNFAGQEGKELRDAFGWSGAGAILYLRNTGKVPSFYDDTSSALRDIERSAAEGN